MPRHGAPVTSDVRARPHSRMGISQLLRWQWESYPKYHQSRPNLLIHIVAVPLFLFGTIVFVGAIAQLSVSLLAVAFGCTLAAVAL